MDEGTNLSRQDGDETSRTQNIENLRSINEGKIIRALKENYIDWFCRLMEAEADCDNFMSVLDNGVLLCQYADKIQRAGMEYIHQNPTDPIADSFPKAKLKFKANNVSSGSFVARDNICNFIRFCRETGIPDYLLFETEDIVLHRNEKSIMASLLELNNLAEKFGVEPPKIEPEPEIIEEIIEEPVVREKTIHVPFDPVSQALDYLIFKEVYRCQCPDQFHVEKVQEGRYRFGENSKTTYAKLMRAQVILRIGGGWNTLGKLLEKMDPCRQGEENTPKIKRKATQKSRSKETPPPGIRWKKAVNKLSDMKLTAMHLSNSDDSRETSGMKQSISSSSICSYDGSSDSSTTSGTSVVKQRPQRKISNRSTPTSRPRKDSASESEGSSEQTRRKSSTPTLQRKGVAISSERYASTPPTRHRDMTRVRTASAPGSRVNTPSPTITRAAVRKSSVSEELKGRRKDSLDSPLAGSPLNIRRSRSFADKDYITKNMKLTRSSSDRLPSKPDHVPEKRVPISTRKASTPSTPRKFSSNSPVPRRQSIDVVRHSVSVSSPKPIKKSATPKEIIKKSTSIPKKLTTKTERKPSLENVDLSVDPVMNGRANSFTSTASSASESFPDVDNRFPASDSGYSLDDALSRSGDESLSGDANVIKGSSCDYAYKVSENTITRQSTPEADAELTDSDVSSSKSSIKELILAENGEDSGLDKSLNKEDVECMEKHFNGEIHQKTEHQESFANGITELSHTPLEINGQSH